MRARRGLHGVEVEGQRLKTRTRIASGYVLAGLHWALKRKEIAAEVRAGAKRILEETPEPDADASPRPSPRR